MTTEEKQERFIWLAHAEGKSFADIAIELNVSRELISKWEVDLKEQWQEVASIKKTYIAKKITFDFKIFHDWYKSIQHNKKCYYCGITEAQIHELIIKDGPLTKRARGEKLELDRLKPNDKYDELENIQFACYWCNNAKTDTFTAEEFMQIGAVLKTIWERRLNKK